MSSQPNTTLVSRHHAGPHLGILAIVYTVLFNGGLCFVSAFGVPFGVKQPYWPPPWDPPDVIVSYFQTHAAAALLCVFLQYGSSIPLGIYAATIVSRLRFLGINAAGPYIALFGGFMTVFNSIVAASITWGMIHPGITQDPTVTQVLYYISYALGGPGFSVPMGLLMAGVCIPAAIGKLLPKWLVTFGLVLAVAGVLSWLNLVLPQVLFLIPLVRFPGFIWLIATGFMLPKVVAQPLRAAEMRT